MSNFCDSIAPRLCEFFQPLDLVKEGCEPAEQFLTPNLAQYWLFFALAYFGFALVYKRKLVRSAYLMLISLFFYWKVSYAFVWILLFSTVSDYYLGHLIHKSEGSSRKWWLGFSIFNNLAVLGYFKYYPFVANSWNWLVSEHGWSQSLTFSNPDGNAISQMLNQGFSGEYFLECWVVIVGISFYTFQTMSYSIDIYRKEIKPLDNILDFGFYVTFFPQLVAGPIVRASEFVPQIHQETKVSNRDFSWALFMILKGLVKKMILADFIATQFLDVVFKMPDAYPGFALLFAIFGYSLQVYGDFAGYTDMAIGMSKLMGFDLPKNFDSPYKAHNCGNFWRRWHLSLSTWLRDYLYIPLGGNRGGTLGSYIVASCIILLVLIGVNNWNVTIVTLGLVATCIVLAWYFKAFYMHISRNINIMLTMLLGGLWHGASWNFVVWGGLNGTGVLSVKYWKDAKEWVKAIAASLMACGFYLIAKSTGYDVWNLFTYWAAAVAIIAFVKFVYGVFGGRSLTNLNWGYGVLHTLVFITFTRIFFRNTTWEKSMTYLHQMWHNFGWSWSRGWHQDPQIMADFWDKYGLALWVIVLGYLLHWTPIKWKDKLLEKFISTHFVVKGIITILVVIICYQTYSSNAPAFIYFAF